jgi:hypothetical protein
VEGVFFTRNVTISRVMLRRDHVPRLEMISTSTAKLHAGMARATSMSCNFWRHHPHKNVSPPDARILIIECFNIS